MMMRIFTATLCSLMISSAAFAQDAGGILSDYTPPAVNDSATDTSSPSERFADMKRQLSDTRANAKQEIDALSQKLLQNQIEQLNNPDGQAASLYGTPAANGLSPEIEYSAPPSDTGFSFISPDPATPPGGGNSGGAPQMDPTLGGLLAP